MIKITVKTSIAREFHLEDAENIANELKAMGYCLEFGEKILRRSSNVSELAAILRLVSPLEKDDEARIEIACGCR